VNKRQRFRGENLFLLGKVTSFIAVQIFGKPLPFKDCKASSAMLVGNKHLGEASFCLENGFGLENARQHCV